MNYNVKIVTWHISGTEKWVGNISYECKSINGSAKFTRNTEKAARNAAFAEIGNILSEVVWED